VPFRQGNKIKEKAESKDFKGAMDENDLQERLFRFAIDVIKMLRNLKEG
jgi:hypothetical protein